MKLNAPVCLPTPFLNIFKLYFFLSVQKRSMFLIYVLSFSEKYESEASNFWDEFYNQHQNRFASRVFTKSVHYPDSNYPDQIIKLIILKTYYKLIEIKIENHCGFFFYF